MASWSSRTLGIPSFLLPFTRKPLTTQTRWLSQTVRRATEVPNPTPFVPDTQTFLTLIGRNLNQHAAKIPSWEALFTFSSMQFKELGIEPPRSRRYLLRWREKFRNGEYGIGGDVKHVKDGVALLRIAESPVRNQKTDIATTPINKKHKFVVNVPEEGSAGKFLSRLPPVKGVQVTSSSRITGPYVLPIKGGEMAKIKIEEGLWEYKRGRKIDGGERRRAEVRAKRRGEEKRAAR